MRQRIWAGTFAVSVAVCLCRAAEPSAGGSDPKSATATSRAPVDLRLKWRPGHRYTYRVEIQFKGIMHFPDAPRMPGGGKGLEQHIESASTYSLELGTSAKEGDTELLLTFLAQELELKMGDRVMFGFDSKSGDSSERGNPFSRAYQFLIGAKFKLVLSPDGTLQRVDGLEDWFKKIADDGPPEAADMMRQFFDADFFRQWIAFARLQPDGPRGPGESWPFETVVALPLRERFPAKLSVTFTGKERRDEQFHARMQFAGSILPVKNTQNRRGPMMPPMDVDEGKVTGQGWFDPELGALVELESEETLKLHMRMSPPGSPEEGKTMRREVDQKTTLRLVEVKKTVP